MVGKAAHNFVKRETNHKIYPAVHHDAAPDFPFVPFDIWAL
jgi:hypothetical protein